MAETAIVVILGHPAVGKRTVGTVLAEQLDGVLVDHQIISVPILKLFRWDGKSVLPAEVWEKTKPIRATILDTIEHLAPPENSYVFTWVWYVADGDGPAELEQLRSLAERRGSRFQVVRLVCDPAAHRPRIDTPDRRALLKGSDTEGYLWHAANVELFFPPEDEVLTLDTSTAAPEDVARAIRTHLGLAGSGS